LPVLEAVGGGMPAAIGSCKAAYICDLDNPTSDGTEPAFVASIEWLPTCQVSGRSFQLARLRQRCHMVNTWFCEVAILLLVGRDGHRGRATERLSVAGLRLSGLC
jgi:hypothetical protein